MKVRGILAAAFIAASTYVVPSGLAIAHDNQRPLHDIGNIIDTALNAYRTSQAIMETAAKDPHVITYYQNHPEIDPVCRSENNREIIKGFYLDFFTPLEDNIGSQRPKFSLENLGYRLERAKTCLEISIAAYTEGRDQISADYINRMAGENPALISTQPNEFGNYFVDQRISRFENSKTEIEKIIAFYGQFGVGIGRGPATPSPWQP